MTVFDVLEQAKALNLSERKELMKLLVDTLVALHIFRKHAPAREWLDSQETPPGFTTISWLEVMFGAPGKAGQAQSRTILNRFELVHLTQADQEWAMQQMELLRLHH